MERRKQLRVNSIERFRKRSDTLHLEEYSHCEVPAGCGGVVLRWASDRSPTPLRLELEVMGKAPHFWINGKPGDSSWLVNAGNSVLAIETSKVKLNKGFLLAAGLNQAEKLVFVSSADGSWRFTTTEPKDESWKQPDFDDSDWKALGRRPLAPPKDSESGTRDTLIGYTAEPLGVPDGGRSLVSKIWIRKPFEFGYGVPILPTREVEITCLSEGICTVRVDQREPFLPWAFEDDYMSRALPGDQGVTGAQESQHLQAGLHVLGVMVRHKKKRCSLVASVVAENQSVVTTTSKGAAWKASATRPPADWLAPDFDDSGWADVELGRIQADALGHMARVTHDEACVEPAEVIAPPRDVIEQGSRLFRGCTVWYRHVFEIESPEEG